jgi:transcriptional regulator with XRE-family HTH domain
MAKKGPNATDKHVGARVRMRREALRISQSTLADALGISFQQIQKYEAGTNRISASRLQQIADILKVPIPFFFEGASHSPGAKADAKDRALSDLSDFLASPEGLALVKSFRRIEDSNLRRTIVALVVSLVGDRLPRGRRS